ncbi:MAG: hypothetical protein WCQ77_09025 [Planctomycetota bacterium]
MTREDLVSLCDEYVGSRNMAAQQVQKPTSPGSEILRSFRLAEISESEMEALLVYVGDPDDEDNCQAAGVAIDRFDDPHADIWQDDDESTESPDQPR